MGFRNFELTMIDNPIPVKMINTVKVITKILVFDIFLWSVSREIPT
jgi:hypothetical protein